MIIISTVHEEMCRKVVFHYAGKMAFDCLGSSQSILYLRKCAGRIVFHCAGYFIEYELSAVMVNATCEEMYMKKSFLSVKTASEKRYKKMALQGIG